MLIVYALVRMTILHNTAWVFNITVLGIGVGLLTGIDLITAIFLTANALVSFVWMINDIQQYANFDSTFDDALTGIAFAMLAVIAFIHAFRPPESPKSEIDKLWYMPGIIAAVGYVPFFVNHFSIYFGSAAGMGYLLLILLLYVGTFFAGRAICRQPAAAGKTAGKAPAAATYQQTAAYTAPQSAYAMPSAKPLTATQPIPAVQPNVAPVRPAMPAAPASQPRAAAQSQPAAQPRAAAPVTLTAQAVPVSQPRAAVQNQPAAQPRAAAPAALTAQTVPASQPRAAAPVAQTAPAVQPRATAPTAQTTPAVQPKAAAPAAQTAPAAQPKASAPAAPAADKADSVAELIGSTQVFPAAQAKPAEPAQDKAKAKPSKKRVKPYRGKDNFIFFSYSHLDTQEALEIVRNIQERGFNVWFDEGIDPGSEWDENIARHIAACAYFIGYITSNYIDSQNCRDELNFARDLDKDRLLIYGEDVELPMGMRMRMNRLQALYKSRYPNQDDFFEKVVNAHGIETCKNKQVIKPMDFTVDDEPTKMVEPSHKRQQ